MWETVGSIDRVVRLAVGLVFLITGMLLLHSIAGLGWLLVVIGAILIITGGTGFCPLYNALGFNTLGEPEDEVYPSWRYYSEYGRDRPRYRRFPEQRRYADQSGSRYRTGQTRDWVWKSGSGTQVRSTGYYQSRNKARWE